MIDVRVELTTPKNQTNYLISFVLIRRIAPPDLTAPKTKLIISSISDMNQKQIDTFARQTKNQKQLFSRFSDMNRKRMDVIHKTNPKTKPTLTCFPRLRRWMHRFQPLTKTQPHNQVLVRVFQLCALRIEITLAKAIKISSGASKDDRLVTEALTDFVDGLC